MKARNQARRQKQDNNEPPTIILWANSSDDTDRLKKFLEERGYKVDRKLSASPVPSAKLGPTLLSGFAHIRTTFMGNPKRH